VIQVKKVLIIEDDKPLLETMMAFLEGWLNVVSADSVDSAREVFAAHPDLDAIVMDGCIEGPGELPNSLVLVLEFRRTFKGPMIAVSNSDEYQDRLMEAGCDHKSYKGHVHRKLKELLSV
jgi:CheY-like chemotaxis protein